MTELEDKLNDVFVKCFAAIAEFERQMVDGLVKYNLSIAEVHLLEAIFRAERDISMGNVAELMRVKPPSVTVAIRKLVKKGMIEQSKCAIDTRKSTVSLTPLAVKIVRAHRWFHAKMIKAMTNQVSTQQLESIISSLEKVNDFFESSIQ